MKTVPLPERTAPLLTVTGLCRSFGEIEVLSGIDAEVRQGEAVAVVGPNGSGKSTLLTDFLADRRARQAGRVRPTRMGGGFAAALARSEWTRLRRRPHLVVRAAAAAAVW